jgi:predicted Rossmann fold nucleotide-binding protein DprA/Smf involved in DNA uptake
MERNTVLFAMSHAAVVCHAKFKEGGAWHAAVNALRRRLCPVFVWEDPDDTACRALIALGAMPLPSPDALPALLSQPHLASQAALFAGF